MTPLEQRNQELIELLTDIKITLTDEGLECWGPPEKPWMAVMFPYNGQDYVLSINPANFYGWLVSLDYHRCKHGKGCSCNPGNNHEGIVEINKAVLQECLQRGLGFARTLSEVRLHTKDSYLKENPTYKKFELKGIKK